MASPSGLVARIDADFSGWPLVTVRATGNVSHAEHAAFIAELDEHVYAKREPYALVMDLRGNGGLSPRQRQRQADRVKQQREDGLRCAGVALVFSSPLLRGMLTAILWVAKPEHPVRVFTDLGEALVWAKDQLRAAAEAAG